MPVSEQHIHRVFQISLLLKGLNSLLEIVLGIPLLFSGTLQRLVIALTRHELIQDPHDLLANYLRHLVEHASVHTEHFAAFYLLSHGILKGFLVVGLLRNKLWIYPIAIVVFALFIVYQVIRYFFTQSIFLIVLTVFDLFVIWLTWHEYRYLKTHRPRLS